MNIKAKRCRVPLLSGQLCGVVHDFITAAQGFAVP